MLICPNCKRNLEISYHISNLGIDKEETFKSLELAEEYFEKVTSKFPLLYWRIYEYNYCSECSFTIKTLLHIHRVI